MSVNRSAQGAAQGLAQSSTPTRRVFFALWPNAQVCTQLQQVSGDLHAKTGGRRMMADSLHLTLVFVGQVTNSQLEEMKKVASVVRGQRFEVQFDQTGCWQHNHIAYLGTRHPPSALLSLVRQIETGLDEAGIAYDSRQYKPHITLIRNADCGALKGSALKGGAVQADASATPSNPIFNPIHWQANDFVLLQSGFGQNRPAGAPYTELGRWPLSSD